VQVIFYFRVEALAVQQSSAVENWIQSWLGEEAELLKPEGWFEWGYGLLGGKMDAKGFW
jgi:hypothetical protein